eukprot:11429351-Prorocentrum_lima.AAC.1
MTKPHEEFQTVHGHWPLRRRSRKAGRALKDRWQWLGHRRHGGERGARHGDQRASRGEGCARASLLITRGNAH